MPHLGRLIALFHFNLLIQIMKKIFGMLLVAVTALVLLPCCGGGGDSDPQKVTATEFQRGAKYFMLGNGLAGTLFVVPDSAFPGYGGEPIPEVGPDGVTTETVAGISGNIGVGSMSGPSATFQYDCYYDENGVPVSAVLHISTIEPQNGNDTLTNFFNEAVGDDEDGGGQQVDLRGEALITIDFRTNRFVMTEDAEEPDADPVSIGGSVIVQRQ